LRLYFSQSIVSPVWIDPSFLVAVCTWFPLTWFVTTGLAAIRNAHTKALLRPVYAGSCVVWVRDLPFGFLTPLKFLFVSIITGIVSGTLENEIE
jgi:hypothetical protein